MERKSTIIWVSRQLKGPCVKEKQTLIPCGRALRAGVRLRSLKSLSQKEHRTDMNIVKIDFERCKECGYCIKFCPKGVLSKGTKVNKKSYYPPVVGEGCIACGTCARVCPDTAISVYKDE